ncbi:MAG: hypothetical protein LCH98_03405 [Actinobacteria bacterium]|nr:hypothetical protein [Actinomycetota bacterium]
MATRDNKPVGELRLAGRRTGRDLRAALAELPAPDDRLLTDVNEAVAQVNQEVPDSWPNC